MRTDLVHGELTRANDARAVRAHVLRRAGPDLGWLVDHDVEGADYVCIRHYVVLDEVL